MELRSIAPQGGEAEALPVYLALVTSVVSLINPSPYYHTVATNRDRVMRVSRVIRGH